MRQQESESSSNIILGKEYVQEKKQALQKIKEQHSRKQTSNDTFVPRLFAISSTCTKQFSRDSLPTTTSATNGLASV